MKERIIGAVVLVVFAVLVVPIFLDGPPGDQEIVTERVLLPGQDNQKTQTVVLDRDRDEPVPSASAQPQPEPATREPERDAPEPAAVQQREPEKAPETPAPTPALTQPAASTTGMWAVQLGSFSNKDNAEKLAADLRKQGYAAFLSQLSTDTGQLHRVRIGPQKDRASAEAMAGRLAKVGHKGQVVPHP
ncbi:MAG: SPOR domain-containing protein [Gammaproteobacteria bacterium]|nr:SPOR domain-containing protein [Gammaproteobacteria bacterium]MDH5619015.1 SPOR domain-containing protein [Gammaproteobacteria bacterium]